jgi:hypothetical protein
LSQGHRFQTGQVGLDCPFRYYCPQ